MTPGYLGEDQSPDARLQTEADADRLSRADQGRGGRRRQGDAQGRGGRQDFAAVRWPGPSARAAASFGDDRVLLETYVTRPRHIEVQVFADQPGATSVHLYERDCSLQRRHQKVIEEAPAPGMDEATRTAVTSRRHQGSTGGELSRAPAPWSLSPTPRRGLARRSHLVHGNEHPPAGRTPGHRDDHRAQDLVEWQIRVADWRAAAVEPKAQIMLMTGHAMEARLYAENPAKKFLPSTGKLEHFRSAGRG